MELALQIALGLFMGVIALTFALQYLYLIPFF